MHKNGNYKPEELLQVKEYNELINATKEVFDTAITHQIGDSMRSYLEQDSFIFSALKTHTQITEASSYLLDQNGNVQPYHLFEQKVNKLNQQYNNNYLKAEYHFAVGAGQSIERWESFSDDEDRYWLQYRTANDDKVRDSHAILHNTTLPKSDPFWDSYTVPNGWSCRCSTVEVLARKHQKSNSEKAIKKGEAATTQINKNGKNTLAMFRFNPAKQKKLFPPNNSYNQVTRAKNVKKLIEEKAEKYVERKSILNKPREEQFKQISKNVYEHRLINKKNDYAELVILSKELAKNGRVTELLPEIDTKNITARQLIFPNYKKTLRTNPDIRNGNLYYDLKRPKAIKNILGNANKASKQGCIAVISDSQLDKVLTNDIINERVKDIFDSKHYTKNQVIFKKGGKLIVFNRTGGK